VNIFSPEANSILAWLWPHLASGLLPRLRYATASGGVLWTEGSSDFEAVRVSEMFVRRYRSDERMSVDPHQDASDLSVSVELSAPVSAPARPNACPLPASRFPAACLAQPTCIIYRGEPRRIRACTLAVSSWEDW
jgi:hypothetical protein